MHKICQSCSLPLKNQDDRGTEQDGSKSDDYCQYCYRMGQFLENMGLSEFIQKQVNMATKFGMSENAARKVAESVLPTLKRWKK